MHGASKATTHSKPSSFRLGKHVRPERYAIELELDPMRSRVYRGRVRIELQLDKPTSVIELHAADLAVSKARLVLGSRTLKARAVLVPEHEIARVAVAEALKGRVTLELSFRGKLRNDLRGLYFAQSGARKYAFTQLEAADARRFFPCFDEPSFKARFAITVTTDKKHTVISNSPAVERSVKGGKQTVRFGETTLISTYLVALGVGELAISETAWVKSGASKRVPIRIVHAPMKGAAKMTRFALDAAAQCLTRLERYFGVPYPYEKLDLVAAPDFEMGAMENVGAVFFRETLLLIDEARATLPEKKRAAEVICHELAHMWYGNLVTMAWWDDLWLNEAFATWMAFEIVDQWQPQLRMWNDFGHSRASAFDLDALSSTHAIYTDVRNAAEATESFDLITYEKGASVIRMLERYLGPERFRAGVRDYIRAHAHGNTVADDLWRALERHAGDDVGRVVRPWIERPGFPVVAVKRSDKALVLEQERFSAAGPHGAKAGEPWPVPMVFRELKTKKPRTERFLLKTKTASIALKPSGAAAAIYANADEGGFYHPLYDAHTFGELLKSLPRLDAAERLGLITHTFALTNAGYMPLGCLIDLALALGRERDPDVLSALSTPLALLLDRPARAAGPAIEATLKDRIARAFAPELDKLGLPATRPKGEPLERSLRRTELLEIVGGIAEDAQVLARASELGARYLQKPASLEPNLGGMALALAARGADPGLHQKYLAASEAAQTPQERRRFRMALAESRDPRCVERTLDLCLTSRIPTQDVAILLSRLCENPAARAPLFARMRRDWPKIAQRLTPALASRFVEASRSLQTDVPAKALLAFMAKAKLPGSTRALSQLKERLALDAALAKRAKVELATYL